MRTLRILTVPCVGASHQLELKLCETFDHELVVQAKLGHFVSVMTAADFFPAVIRLTDDPKPAEVPA